MPKCLKCRTPYTGSRLPRGWKNVGGPVCGDCFRGAYVLRAITIPVSVPIGVDAAGEPWTWASFNAVLAAVFRLSTDTANWAVQTLYRLDTPGGAKAPESVTKWYGYAAAEKDFPRFADWAGAKQGLNIVIRGVQRKYRQNRFAVLVRNDQSLLTYRYPYPYPVDADGWRPDFEKEVEETVTAHVREGRKTVEREQATSTWVSSDSGDAWPTVRVQIPGVGSVRLRLRRNGDCRRQLTMMRQFVVGEAVKGEGALYRDRKGRLLWKMVGYFPRRPPGERVNACLLHTDPEAFLVAEVDGRRPWLLYADHLRRWQAAHRSYLTRVADEGKREKRMDRRQRSGIDKSRFFRCGKHRDRLDTAVHQLTTQVVRFCERQKVATVAYDDSIRTYFPDDFPWHQVQEQLRYKLDAIGVEVVAREP